MPGPNEARRTRRRAVTLVPIAIASAAITAQVATLGGPALTPFAASQGPVGPTYDPIRPSVPQAAIEAPASLSNATMGGSAADSADAVDSIPSAALAAYQRAEVVINDADAVCGMPWELVAAVGRVESNHGRVGGSSLNGSGVAAPAIYGVALDGTNNTRAVADTDAGRYDNDTQWDRAVGPMQFIPTTWSQVGVDGDADGRRDPQDIDDAALAAAVYLCAGDDDLSTEDGQRASLFRYNHSTAYVDLVLGIMEAYQAGDWSANGTTAASTMVEDPTTPVVRADGPRTTGTGQAIESGGKTTTPTAQPSARPSATASPKPTTKPTQPTSKPTVEPKPEPGTKPTTKPTPGPLSPVTTPLQPVLEPVLEPVLSLTQALNLCKSELNSMPDPLGLRVLLAPLVKSAAAACADEVVGKPLAEATGLIPNTLRGLLVWLGLIKA